MEREFIPISEHVFIYPYDGFTDRPNIGLIVGSKHSILYDAGNSASHVRAMQSSIKKGLPIPDFCCLSHSHWDHSFGAHAWKVPVIAGRETNERLKVMQHWRWDDLSMKSRVISGEEINFCHEMIRREYPDRNQIKVTTADIVFEGRMSVDLGGGIVVELIHCKGPHSSDSVLLYVPSDHFLFLGDSNCKDLYGLPWEFDINREEDFKKNTDALPYDQKKVKEYLDLLDTLHFTSCISGHAKLITRDQLLSKFI